MLSVEVSTPKLGPLSRQSWTKFVSDLKIYKNRGGKEDWTSLIEPKRLESLRAMFIENIGDYEAKLLKLDEKIVSLQEELQKKEKLHEETDKTLATKRKKLMDEIEDLSKQIDKLNDETLAIVNKIDEDLFEEMSKSFGCSTTKDVMDVVSELKMEEHKWEFDNFTHYATVNE
ncbi:hypothetical protein ADUPG1_012349 [Aduncisulcus paluster]|uniref:Uncharacterized protein n=1 Tax=Aduncisulcus paluster TaxID=2918883 RepID=A0ABQ5JZ68_9EUKA|nr:hypothetical protein ADUPG1_012349 [Aduncisulcus paluster]